MPTDDDDWTWELVVATLDEALPTVSVRPGLARVAVPTEDGRTRDVHLVMTVDLQRARAAGRSPA